MGSISQSEGTFFIQKRTLNHIPPVFSPVLELSDELNYSLFIFKEGLLYVGFDSRTQQLHRICPGCYLDFLRSNVSLYILRYRAILRCIHLYHPNLPRFGGIRGGAGVKIDKNVPVSL